MAQHGVALFDKDGAGFAVTSLEAPAVSLNRPGLWTWSGDFIPKKSERGVFQTSSVRVEHQFYGMELRAPGRLISLSCLSGNTIRRRARAVPSEFTTPFYAAFASGPAGKHPLTCAGVEVSERTLRSQRSGLWKTRKVFSYVCGKHPAGMYTVT